MNQSNQETNQIDHVHSLLKAKYKKDLQLANAIAIQIELIPWWDFIGWIPLAIKFNVRNKAVERSQIILKGFETAVEEVRQTIEQ